LEPDHRKTFRACPYSGIYLDRSVLLDCSSPGFLASSFFFPPLKRQAIFLAFAVIDWKSPQEAAARLAEAAPGVCQARLDPLAVIARALTVLRPRAILRAVLGAVPDGLCGTLARLGMDPIAPIPSRYHALLRMFSSARPDDRARVRLLGRMHGNIDPKHIPLISVLDPMFLLPDLIPKIGTLETAYGLRHAVQHLQTHCSAATDEALRQSLQQIGNKRLKDWLRGWAARFDSLPHPLPWEHDDQLVILKTGAAMVEAGREERNCLGSKCAEVIMGRRLYAEYRLPGGARGLIVELRHTSGGGGWFLEQLYARDNKRIAVAMAVDVRARLAAHGVMLLDRAHGDPVALAATAGLLNIVDWGSEDIGGYGFEMADFSEPQGAMEILENLSEAA
jgi:hypothetical protein